MSDASRIRYIPRPDTTPETERDVLAAVIRFALDCQAKEEGDPTTSGPAEPTQRPERGDEHKR